MSLKLRALTAIVTGLFMFPSFAATDPAELLQEFEMQKGYSEISQNIANALIESNDKIALIDVRSPEEFREGHIDGAVNIPVENIKEHQLLDGIPTSTPLLLYCRTGRRATTAGQMLVRSGYQYVMNFGGVTTWQFGLTAGD